MQKAFITTSSGSFGEKYSINFKSMYNKCNRVFLLFKWLFDVIQGYLGLKYIKA